MRSFVILNIKKVKKEHQKKKYQQFRGIVIHLRNEFVAEGDENVLSEFLNKLNTNG